jgi:hypothetical protein
LKYLNISSNDYANCAHNNAVALRAAGVTCDDYTLETHVFGYKEQSVVVNSKFIKAIYKRYDVVQVFHSCPLMLSLVKDHPNLTVMHSGTRYRENPVQANKLFNPVVKRSFTDQTEFISLGAHNLHYLAPHTDLKPVPKRMDGKLVVGHFPSHPEVKGTKEIIAMLEPYRDDFEIRIDTTIVPHEENLRRIAETHIYVELFKPELNGKEYGCMGVTAFEAAALGCYCITNNLHEQVYTSVYGPSPFRIANTREEFQKVFEIYRHIKPGWYHTISTPASFYENHSARATGERIIQITKNG